MFELSVTGDFAAAHILRGYGGKCENLHGHTWKVEVTLRGEELDDVGMVVDFAVVKKQLRGLLKTLDHVHLNDLPAFREVNPTTENLAKYILEEFSPLCRPLDVVKVRVWESDSASVTYYK